MAVAMRVSEAAAEYVLSDRPPLYAELDCFKFVRQCVRDCGGEMRYSGSNDVFRNGCAEVMPLGDAIAYDKLKSGWALFIVEPESESTPAKYRGDGWQDASHMGLFTDMHVTRPDGAQHYVEVAHSSASRGGVVGSKLQNAWNWAGRLKDVDYSEWDETEAMTVSRYATVDVPEGEHLRMRETPGPDGRYVLRIPRGKELEATAHENGFARVRYGGFTGWVDERFLRYTREAVSGEAGSSGAAPGTVEARLLALRAEVDALLSEVRGEQ